MRLTFLYFVSKISPKGMNVCSTTLLPCHVAEYAGVDVCDGVAAQVECPQLREAGEGGRHAAQLVGGEVKVGQRGQRC